MSYSPIILALDTTSIDQAAEWIDQTRDCVDIYKIGLEFFIKNGPLGVEQLRKMRKFELFLDLKLHDIPNTVRGAAESIANLSPRFLTVHAAGGRAMMGAAVQALPGVSITAVTILTALSDADVKEIGFVKPALESALSLAELSVAAGARAIVCSPLEVGAIRSVVPDSVILITPGVRPTGSALNDQTRTMTPHEALHAGANFVVIGRPITASSNPGESAREILTQISNR